MAFKFLVGVSFLLELVFWLFAAGIYGYDYAYPNGDYLLDNDADDWKSMDVRSIMQKNCVQIPRDIGLCRNVGYNSMRLPNLLGHETVEEVKRQASPWDPLHNVGCHPNSDLFLCSLYAPVCLDRAIYPCRSLCESVKEKCEKFMNKYGFEWPEILRCEQFPGEGDLCIRQPEMENNSAANVCDPCKKPLTYESLLDSYCWSEYVFKVKIRKVVMEKNGDKRLVLKGKVKPFKPKKMSNEEKSNLKLVIRNGDTCECNVAERANGSSFITASKVGDEYVVSYVSDWTKNKDFKRAVRAMRKGHDCKLLIPEQPDANGGLSINGGPLPTVKPPETDNRTNGDKEKKKRKGKGKGNKKKNKNKKGKKNKDKKEDKEKDDDSDPMANFAGIGCIPCKQPLVFENLIEKYCDSNFVVKVRVRKIQMESNGDKKLIVRRLKPTDFYKQQNLSQKDIKKLQPVIGGGSSCDCEKAKKGAKLFIMGKKEGLRHVITFLDEDAKDSEFDRFQKAIKNGYNCKT